MDIKMSFLLSKIIPTKAKKGAYHAKRKFFRR